MQGILSLFKGENKMKKNVLMLAIGALLLSVIVVTGCNVVASLTTDTSSTIPGVVSSKASVSATITVSGTTYSLTIGTIAVTTEAGTFEALPSLGADRFKIFKVKAGSYSGTGTPPIGFPSGLDAATAVVIGLTLTDVTKPGIDTTKPLDVVFLLDSTGSMGSALDTTKAQVGEFAAYLETKVSDVKFAVQTFGDVSCESRSPLSGGTLLTSAQAKTFLNSLPGAGAGPGGSGGDGAENPIEATVFANTYTPWRSGAQRMIVIITDNSAHRLGDGATNVYDLGGASRACGMNLTTAEAVLKANPVTTIVNTAGPSWVTAPYQNIRDLSTMMGGIGIDYNSGFATADLMSLASLGGGTYKTVTLGDLTGYDFILIYVASGTTGYDTYKVIPLSTVGTSSMRLPNN